MAQPLPSSGWKTWVIGALTLIASGLSTVVVRNVWGEQSRVENRLDVHDRLLADHTVTLAVVLTNVVDIQSDIKEIKQLLKERLPAK